MPFLKERYLARICDFYKVLLRFDASLVHGVVVVVENDGPVIDSTGGRPPVRQEVLGTYEDSIQEKGGYGRERRM